ncbi:sensor histidine kinase [Hoyosella subflava]|uniref:sensor histidine kinase n=1 Tax=Hoyosella subflava TaxID=639313 RepID=UPI00059DE481|nr:ATP-binding protein [Hoyosella subflava]
MPMFQGRARESTAVDRTTVVLGLALGIAGIAFIGIEYPSVLSQWSDNPLWWLIPAVFVVPGMYCAMIVAALRRSARGVRALCAVYPLCFLPIALTIPIAFEYRELAPMHNPWPLLVGSGTIIAASFVIPMRGIIALAACYSGIHSVATYWAQYDVTYGWALREGVSIAMIGVIFAAVVRSVVNNARTIDHATLELREAALRRARTSAIWQERERVDALIHDTVVSTFVSACNHAPLESVKESARQSRDTLDGLAFVDDTERSVDALEFTARLRQVVTDISDDISTEHHNHAGDATYPIEVARMFQEVIAEAARNSVRHAGLHAQRALRKELFPDSIRVTMADDGSGFDPETVPPLRLGLNTGMRARVAHVPGASITIDSEVGRGTTVTVRWQRDE